MPMLTLKQAMPLSAQAHRAPIPDPDPAPIEDPIPIDNPSPHPDPEGS